MRGKPERGLTPATDFARRSARRCELNVGEQVVNVGRTSILRDAWERGQDVTVHGWIYGLHDGLLSDLNTTVASLDDVRTSYAAAIAQLPMRANT